MVQSLSMRWMVSLFLHSASSVRGEDPSNFHPPWLPSTTTATRLVSSLNHKPIFCNIWYISWVSRSHSDTKSCDGKKHGSLLHFLNKIHHACIYSIYFNLAAMAEDTPPTYGACSCQFHFCSFIVSLLSVICETETQSQWSKSEPTMSGCTAAENQPKCRLSVCSVPLFVVTL